MVRRHHALLGTVRAANTTSSRNVNHTAPLPVPRSPAAIIISRPGGRLLFRYHGNATSMSIVAVEHVVLALALLRWLALPADPAGSSDNDRGAVVRTAYNAGMYYQTIRQMQKLLGQLDKWLEAATTHAQARKFDPAVYLTLRLAPDQFAFARQVQTACDTAKLVAARLAGKEAPAHPDTEQTLDELRARIRLVVTYLEGFSAADFEGAATRTVTQPRWEGKVMTGADYFLEHGLPNFFFHLTHAYAILRHGGVNLGKRDYLGPLTQRLP
jgi:hypothetical protein